MSIRSAQAHDRLPNLPLSPPTLPRALPAQVVDPLLMRLPDIKQWVIFGFLLNPEELSQPGAVDLLFSVLNTM